MSVIGNPEGVDGNSECERAAADGPWKGVTRIEQLCKKGSGKEGKKEGLGSRRQKKKNEWPLKKSRMTILRIGEEEREGKGRTGGRRTPVVILAPALPNRERLPWRDTALLGPLNQQSPPARAANQAARSCELPWGCVVVRGRGCGGRFRVGFGCCGLVGGGAWRARLLWIRSLPSPEPLTPSPRPDPVATSHSGTGYRVHARGRVGPAVSWSGVAVPGGQRARASAHGHSVGWVSMASVGVLPAFTFRDEMRSASATPLGDAAYDAFPP